MRGEGAPKDPLRAPPAESGGDVCDSGREELATLFTSSLEDADTKFERRRFTGEREVAALERALFGRVCALSARKAFEDAAAACGVKLDLGFVGRVNRRRWELLEGEREGPERGAAGGEELGEDDDDDEEEEYDSENEARQFLKRSETEDDSDDY